MSHFVDDKLIIPSLSLSAGIDGDKTLKKTYFSAEEIDVNSYENIVLCMSGGKDSIASLLRLLDMGVDRKKIELWHHDVDGREGSTLMDWPFMADYNRKLAEQFGIPLYFSWLEGGFEGEMLKNNSLSKPHKVETPNGLITLERDAKRGKKSTRLKFPQVSASLQTRWCSSALKIDVGRRALTNQSRFDGRKVLFITGERREESSNRAKYNQLEPHMVDCRNGKKSRHVDAWRPVLHWSEDRVWDALKRHDILAPVPYRLGWGRSSCMKCIFNGPSIWATIQHYFPEELKLVADYENQFGLTISRNKKNVIELASDAKPMHIDDIDALSQAMEREYTLPVLAHGKWHVPKGAFADFTCGPS